MLRAVLPCFSLTMIHEKLQPYCDQKNLKKLSKLLVHVEKELVQCGCTRVAVELTTTRPPSFTTTFFGIQPIAVGDQLMAISAQRDEGQTVVVKLPLRKGRTLPYKINIALVAKADGAASRHKHLGWLFEPPNRARAKQLKKLKLPDVIWNHGVRGVFSLNITHEITDNMEMVGTSNWVVSSGYDGFAIRRPAVAVYIEAAPRLEALLDSEGYRREHHVAALPAATIIDSKTSFEQATHSFKGLLSYRLVHYLLKKARRNRDAP